MILSLIIYLMKESSRHLDMNCPANLCSERAFSPPPVLSLGIQRAAAPSLPPSEAVLSASCCAVARWLVPPAWLSYHLGDTTSPPAQGLYVGQQPGNCWRFDSDSNAYHFFFFIAIMTAKHISLRAGKEVMSLKPDKVVSL